MEMITIKTEQQIELMRQGGQILAKVMSEVAREVKAGVTTKYLNKVAEDLISKSGAKPSFKHYEGFPDAMCISVNEEIVHVKPSNRILKEGDIVCLDLGVKYKGYHSDMAITVGVGKISDEAKRLIEVTKESLKIGILNAKAGKRFGDAGSEIQKYVESHRFGVVRDLCGHGIGKQLHEDPQILNYGKPGTGEEIKKGMVFCIEPMVTVGDWHIVKASDSYGYKTRDNSLAAHFEHTIAITNNGTEVLTELSK